MTDAPPSRTDILCLRVLCTTDLHGHVRPFDYQTDRCSDGRGIAPLASLVRRAREEAPNTLLVDCGDILQGTALADWAARPAPAGTRTESHPMIAAMNLMGYDAAALGNHDFDYGLPPLTRALEGAAFPVLCANLVAELGETPDTDTPLVPPWCVLDRTLTAADGRRRTLRIGLIGTAPPRTVIWDAAALRGALAARDAVETVRGHLPALRRAGADIVIALSHSGIGRPDPAAMDEDTSLALAQIDGIDVVLTGHSHARLPGPDFAGLPGVDAAAGRLAGKPAAMAGAFGSDLAVLDLTLAQEGTRWRVAQADVALRTAAGIPPDPAILAQSAPAHEATRAQIGQIVGRSRSRLHSVFAMAARAPALALLAQAQAARARQLVAGTPLSALPLLSAVAPFKHGGPNGPDGFVDIPAGPLRRRHLVELSPFPNRLCVMALTGADLRNWLERVASVYLTVPRGARDAPLIDPGAAAYTFDEIHGLHYTLDLSRPPRFGARDGAARPDADTAGRVTGLHHAGLPVQPGDRFAMATNSYRASGGGGFAMIPANTPRLHSAEPLLDILIAHVAAAGEIAIADPAPMRFDPLGATAVVATSTAANLADHGDPERDLQPLGLDAEGFQRFRLAL